MSMACNNCSSGNLPSFRLIIEDAQAEFIELLRTLMRIETNLVNFPNLTMGSCSAQEFEDYKSKYLDLYDGRSKTGQKESILDDLDFEVELFRLMSPISYNC